jgi:hypothetical protein
VWWRNRVEEPPTPVADLLLPNGVARLIGLVGVVAAVACLLLFLLPGLGIDIWPGMLTPLTARVMGAIFALATVGIAAFRYRRWSGMQILLQVEGLMLVLIAVALVRARDDFAASRPLTWLFTVGLCGARGGFGRSSMCACSGGRFAPGRRCRGDACGAPSRATG